MVPTAWEAEAGELLEPGRLRLRSAKITPLHSSLGNNSETPSQKKKKVINIKTIDVPEVENPPMKNSAKTEQPKEFPKNNEITVLQIKS